jgi:hypothetical protein
MKRRGVIKITFEVLENDLETVSFVPLNLYLSELTAYMI